MRPRLPGGLSLLFAGAVGLVLPILLLPIVALVGYSEIIEEIAKAMVVLALLAHGRRSRNLLIGAAVVFGISFGVSENLFYLNNFFQIGDFTVFWQRFVWTMPMHVLTVLILMFAGLISRRLIVLGLVGTIVLHMLFNAFVAHVM